MLVLTRRLMERVFIGEDICVTVVRLENGQVRLGIEAPRDVPVVREELLRRWSTARPSHGSDEMRIEVDHLVDDPIRTPPASVHGIDSRRPELSR